MIVENVFDRGVVVQRPYLGAGLAESQVFGRKGVNYKTKAAICFKNDSLSCTVQNIKKKRKYSLRFIDEPS